MRRSHLLAMLAACVLVIGLVAVYSDAQPPAGRPPVAAARPGPFLVLLDVPSVFKQHAGFKQMMNNMKASAQRDEEQLKAERDAIQKLTEMLKDFRRGSAEYKARAEEITKRQADLAVQLRLHQDEYRQREAAIFYKVYNDMLAVVDYYARANGISMVLKFNSETANLEEPESVVPFINRRVVWHAGNLDITQVILNELNRRGAFPPPGATPPAGANPRMSQTPHGVNFNR